MALNKSCAPSDFLKMNEANLHIEWTEFDRNCERLNEKFIHILNSNEDLSDSCEELCKNNCITDDDDTLENPNCVLQEIQDLQACLKNFDSDLKSLNYPTEKDEDENLMGRPFNEQNEILSQRLTTLEKTKHLNQKIIRNLSTELEKYQQKVEPLIEAEVLRNLGEMRKAHEKKIESQLNAEVQRIQKAFVNKWNQTLKVKRKFDRIDWKLRTELQPKITNMSQQLFDKKEKLVKIQLEVANLEKQQADQLKKNEMLEMPLENLKNEFWMIRSEVNHDEREVKRLKKRIIKTSLEIENVKRSCDEDFTNLQEDRAIYDRMTQIYKDNMESQLNQACKSTLNSIVASDCIIGELKAEIYRATRSIRSAEIQKAKLKEDVEHLMNKRQVAIVGRDYLNSNFMQAPKEHCK